MSENVVDFEDLDGFLRNKPKKEEPHSQAPQGSYVQAPKREEKSSHSIMQELEAKVKLMEVGGSLLEKIFVHGNTLVDKIVNAKKMQYMAENSQQQQAQGGKSLQDTLTAEFVYEGISEFLGMFIENHPDLKVQDLLQELQQDKEKAINMIGIFMQQKFNNMESTAQKEREAENEY